MDDGGSTKNPFLRLFSKKQTDDEQMEKEIISMVDEVHEQGVLQESEAMMIHNIFEFGDKEAKDIMTHRKNIVAIDGDMPFNEAMKLIIEQNHSRFPVYEGDIDNIVGAIHIREVLMYAREERVQELPVKEIEDLVFDVDFIPETKNINSLFREMQAKKNHIVIVVDEYGQTAGIVALEDILEEIVGNILDEHDEEEHTIEQIDTDTYIMQGVTPLEEVEEILKIPFELEDYETLNGYLTALLGKIPSEDEEFSVEGNGCRFDVLSVNNKMIEKVRVTKLPEKDGDETQSCQKEEKMVE
ncbi:MAG: hemolysin family protein [Lachnospiraceae bacterium]|nr:hemolysin family protein [Lachnospiraceae bacterium]MDD6183652.1 hemolysin family protein [Lachnospiraceae bacterium]MDD7377776.1 hemolysin family protein [Lachnospiraceae bacterium]MDY4616163.1 hemolysin family protein [Lachnospiraceae bacterium]MDY5775092.1 hemolysin family protein [Lachnospiraceae bacterium]